MTVASIDFESRSTIDLRKAGLHRYFEAETTEILCMAYRIGDGPVRSWRPDPNNDDMPWRPHYPPPDDLAAHIAAGGMVIAHNNAFDRHAWGITFDTPLPLDQCDCTMARGAAMALPQSLDQLGKALNAPFKKDPVGHRLMMSMCKPKTYDDMTGEPVWNDTPAQRDVLLDYCMADVSAERAIDRIVPQLSARERKIWLLDQTINDRGVQIDVDSCNRALAAVTVAKERADKLMSRITQGHVKKCTEVAKLVTWLNSRGIVCESVAKGEVEELILFSGIMNDETAKDAIELRRAAAKSSTAKYTAITNSVCRDGRVRGSLRYHGASTGRWAGSGMQPQNFPRIRDPEAVATALALLNMPNSPAEVCDIIYLLLGEPMSVLSQCLRSMIIAKPGHRLMGADYANIEGRVNAWLAGEDWKVEAFAAFDEGTGVDLYVNAYAKAFGIAPDDVNKDQRQIGKVMELSMGFQGGWRAFEKMGANYGISVGQERGEELKSAWRIAHPSITASWWELQDAAIEAVSHPGLTIRCLYNRIAYKVAHGFLWCMLPSGRTLSYAAPRMAWSEPTPELSSRPGVEFDAVDSLTKKWGRHRLYGGLQCENIVQAVARDVLADAMLNVEAAGFPVVLTIHDEIIAEMPDGVGSVEHFEQIMACTPKWAEGLPVAVKGWEDKRYVK